MTSEVCASMFHWDIETGYLSQELSTLEANNCDNPLNSQIYDMGQYKDGFKVMSSKYPGKFVRFVFDKEDRYGEETYGWKFRAVNEANTKAMGAGGVKVLIIND